MGWICYIRMRRDGRDVVGGRFSLGPSIAAQASLADMRLDGTSVGSSPFS